MLKIKKPFLTIIIVIFVVAAIAYIEMQKAGFSKENAIAESSPKNGNNPGGTWAASAAEQKMIAEKDIKYQKAPDFAGIVKWINSEPLSMEQLRGRVVLVDFWTYTCINCIRTLPYLKDWDKKYRDKGLVIVGVHSPEFEFEKKYENVLKAVNDYGVKYAVAQDNNYGTWNSFQNRYWPNEFLIDIDGYIRHEHIGEGNYEETEQAIQSLLKERMERINSQESINQSIVKPLEAVEINPFGIKTPEIYLGYQFTRGNFGNPEGLKHGETINYRIPASLQADNVYFSGAWKNNADNMELAGDEGSIMLIFQAKVANIVAGSEKGSQAYISLDNDAENEKNKGSDVVIGQNKSISGIKESRLYNVASAEDYGTHFINIDVVGKGFKLYTFTFG